jgi:hypothetical protein
LNELINKDIVRSMAATKTTFRVTMGHLRDGTDPEQEQMRIDVGALHSHESAWDKKSVGQYLDILVKSQGHIEAARQYQEMVVIRTQLFALFFLRVSLSGSQTNIKGAIREYVKHLKQYEAILAELGLLGWAKLDPEKLNQYSDLTFDDSQWVGEH